MSEEPEAYFHSDTYLAINQARLRHLDSLVRLAVKPRARVLEVAAGIGDLTQFWIDRGFPITVTEGRQGNIAAFMRRHPGVPIAQHDLEGSQPLPAPYDVVHAYGILYHLRDPARGLAQMAAACSQILLLETCVSFGGEALINQVEEPASNPTQAVGGLGCRPTRRWLFEALRSHFPFVYLPRTQPDHDEFPLDWTDESSAKNPLTRSIFVASRRPIEADDMSDRLLMRQVALA